MNNTKQNLLFENYFSYKLPQPQYLGAKYKHLEWIGKFIPNNVTSILDAFSGSQSVSFYFKQRGLKVLTNDFLNFNHQIGLGLIENSRITLDNSDITILLRDNQNITEFNLMETLFTDVFFTLSDSKWLDSVRSNIAFLELKKQCLAFTIINRAITRKITMGHFAHTKALEYANNIDRVKRNRNLARPIKDIFLDLVPAYNNCIFDNGQNNKSYNQDAITLVENLQNEVDLLYLDPPYCGSHADYQSFYHLLETYVEYWKDKEFKNQTKSYFPKKQSGFDKKQDSIESFTRLFQVAENIPYWIISYNNRSYPNEELFIEMLCKHKKVRIEYKEYLNNYGGKGSVKGSKEILFICSPK